MPPKLTMRSSLVRPVVSTSQNATDAGTRSSHMSSSSQLVCRRNSTPPPPKPRGDLSALAGQRSEPIGSGLKSAHPCSVQGVDGARVFLHGHHPVSRLSCSAQE